MSKFPDLYARNFIARQATAKQRAKERGARAKLIAADAARCARCHPFIQSLDEGPITEAQVCERLQFALQGHGVLLPSPRKIAELTDELNRLHLVFKGLAVSRIAELEEARRLLERLDRKLLPAIDRELEARQPSATAQEMLFGDAAADIRAAGRAPSGNSVLKLAIEVRAALASYPFNGAGPDRRVTPKTWQVRLYVLIRSAFHHAMAGANPEMGFGWGRESAAVAFIVAAAPLVNGSRPTADAVKSAVERRRREDRKNGSN